MSSPDWPVLHLRIPAEPDPGVLARVLERFRHLNVTPRRALAEVGDDGHAARRLKEQAERRKTSCR